MILTIHFLQVQTCGTTWRSRRPEQWQKKTASATAKKKDSIEVEVKLPTISH